ncbi:sulfatase-like hydrolase/transferase [Pontiella sulfatireligans]|uniref:Arylsulfatase n=1 Tax=Pontiella sulfatireligans TaxID=2750658 RepID=A0A6C2UJK7_9BACT|nr:sulfatase-like hydrolase/transferase [Pontiella sulfatireligans]SPS74329.1 sulfatase S1_25 [Kiritimatiellales bacterium]VGO19386.1 Arylsulfatase [Pontiella sulfatireligans]
MLNLPPIREGLRFSNAYISNPICMPSRVSFLTGQYERVHGVGFSSRHELSMKQWKQTYPQLLRKNGYFTGFIGKLGVDKYPFKNGRGGETFDFWCAHDGWAAFFPKGKKNCIAYEGLKEDIITPMMGEAFENFLNQKDADKPFCLSVSFSAPHGSITGSMIPWEQGKGRMKHPANGNKRLAGHPIYGDLYRDVKIELPVETATDAGQFIPSELMKQDGRKNTYSFSYDLKTSLEQHYRYYQLITGIDHVVGRMIQGLEKRGLLENTIIIYSSDHGLLMGEYGMGGKALAYDLTAKVPFILYDPSLPKDRRGEVLDALVMNVDVAPTILDYAGLPELDFCQGRSLVPLVQNPDIPWRDSVFIENLFVGRDNPFVEAVRFKKWKYVRYFDHSKGWNYDDKDVDFRNQTPVFEQLFDLERDPEERVNLMETGAFPETLEQLRKKCRSESKAMIEFRNAFRKRISSLNLSHPHGIWMGRGKVGPYRRGVRPHEWLCD